MKVGLKVSLLASLFFLQGCVMNAKKDEAPYGGLMQVGVIHESEFNVVPQDTYLGLDSVGILALAESGENARTALKQAEQVLLSSADYTQARLLLGRVLFLIPDHRRARKLVLTIDSDPSQKLKSLNIDPSTLQQYTVRSNDNIQSLARRFLGDADYFPILMRLNQLESGELAVDQVILIPEKEIKPVRRQAAAVVQPVVTSVPEEQEAQVSELDEQIEVAENEPRDEVLEELEGPAADAVNTDIQTTALAEQPSAQPEEEKDTAAESEGITDLAGSSGAAQAEEEPVAEPEVIHSEYSEQEKLAFQAYGRGDAKTAYRLLKDSAADREGQVDALFHTLQRELVEAPYARGLQYYQEQKLNLAIAEFDKVLAVEPQHGQALLYKARCTELLARLRTIE